MTIDGEIRAARNLEDKLAREEMWYQEKSECDGGSRKRTGENPGNTGSSEYQEKESNLCSGLFPILGEGD
jgi:hypothetical protein